MKSSRHNGEIALELPLTPTKHSRPSVKGRRLSILLSLVFFAFCLRALLSTRNVQCLTINECVETTQPLQKSLRKSEVCPSSEVRPGAIFYWNESCTEWPLVTQRWFVGANYERRVKQTYTSLYTVATPNRISMLLHSVSQWNGPYVVALYLRNESEADEIKTHFSSSKFRNVRIDVVWAIDQDPTYPMPINFCRNVAFSACATSHVLMVDVDFVVFPHNLSTRRFPLTRDAFILPAFETNNTVLEPTSRNLLTTDNNFYIFGQGAFRKRPYYAGHNDTGYDRFFDQSQTEPYPLFDSEHHKWQYFDGYEPYFVIPRHFSPPWPEELTYGLRNKIGHRLRVDGAGFKYRVLRDAWVVHYPHRSERRHSILKKYGINDKVLFVKRVHEFVDQGKEFGKNLDELFVCQGGVQK